MRTLESGHPIEDRIYKFLLKERFSLEDLRMFQALEQLQATLRDFAPVICSYHKYLVENGMTRKEATQVVIAWQTTFFGKNNGQ
jgi:hypothetical protein